MDEKDLLVKSVYEKDELRQMIRDGIKAKKTTQREIARQIGIYPQNLSVYLAGRCSLSVKKLKQITDILGL